MPLFFRGGIIVIKILCRAFQAVMKIGMYTLPWTTPEVIEGENSSCNIAEDMKNRCISRVLVVMGPHMMQRGLPLPMLEGMDKQGIEYKVFDSITSDPTDLQVEDGVRMYKEIDAQAIVLFGGGSPMDCGKAIAARIARPDKTVAQLQGVLKVRKRKEVPFIYAVPTTAGTGSEATIAAVIIDHETHRKKSINDISIIPHLCVLDPVLTVGLPPEITADTGMDALCHAVEAYTNNKYNTQVENDMAKNAVKLIYDNLYEAYCNGSNISARRNMQKAAFYAGRAFTRGCVGYVHAIGHAIGSVYRVPHGRVIAALLPEIMTSYGKAAAGRLAELADYCGMCSDDEQQMTNEQKAAKFIEWIKEMNEKMKMPDFLGCIIGKDIPKIAKWANAEANPLYPVPKVFNRDDLEWIIAISRENSRLRNRIIN